MKWLINECHRSNTILIFWATCLNIEYLEVRARLASDDTIVGHPLLLVEPRREPVGAFGVRQVSGNDNSAGVHVRLQVFAQDLIVRISFETNKIKLQSTIEVFHY